MAQQVAVQAWQPKLYPPNFERETGRHNLSSNFYKHPLLRHHVHKTHAHTITQNDKLILE